MMKINPSQTIKLKNGQKVKSSVVKAPKGTGASGQPPKGVWGRRCEIKSSGVHIKSWELNVEFTIPFDDDLDPNEAEIVIYNLSDDTVKRLKRDNKITVIAGYKGDMGEVFEGYIKRVRSSWQTVDRVTVIKALDDFHPRDRKLESKSFKKGTKASFILRNLVKQLNIPVATIKLERDYTYKDKITVSGRLIENIQKYAEICGVSTYISKGKAYIRDLNKGDTLNFTVSEETGMVGTPEEFVERNRVEKYKDKVKGWRITMLLQHRMQTAGIVDVKSRAVKGTFRIRGGTHTFNDGEAITEIEVV